MRTVVAIAVLVAAFIAAMGGCVTPSIPIPPPDPQQMTFDLDVDTGQGTFTYPASSHYENAIVYVYNRTAGEGIITTARADGSVGPSQPFPAALDDEINVTFESDAQVAGTCVVLTASGPRPQCD